MAHFTDLDLLTACGSPRHVGEIRSILLQTIPMGEGRIAVRDELEPKALIARLEDLVCRGRASKRDVRIPTQGTLRKMRERPWTIATKYCATFGEFPGDAIL